MLSSFLRRSTSSSERISAHCRILSTSPVDSKLLAASIDLGIHLGFTSLFSKPRTHCAIHLQRQQKSWRQLSFLFFTFIRQLYLAFSSPNLFLRLAGLIVCTSPAVLHPMLSSSTPTFPPKNLKCFNGVFFIRSGTDPQVTIVCLSGLFFADTSLANCLLWAIPAEHVKPNSDETAVRSLWVIWAPL